MYIPKNKYQGVDTNFNTDDLKFIAKLMVAGVIIMGSYVGILYLICR